MGAVVVGLLLRVCWGMSYEYRNGMANGISLVLGQGAAVDGKVALLWCTV